MLAGIKMSQEKLQKIYLDKIKEVLDRLKVCESFLDSYNESQSVFVFEAAVLQMRKALECVAYAAIAPNKKEYAEFRANAESQPDYTKDFHAGKIMQLLAKINPDFYPKPVSAPINKGPGKWHFENRDDESLTKKKLESFYDRLGKFLHADNPWGHDKGQTNLLKEIPEIIKAIRLLLSWHYTTIRTQDFNGVWVVEIQANEQPHIIVGQAMGEFSVK